MSRTPILSAMSLACVLGCGSQGPGGTGAALDMSSCASCTQSKDDLSGNATSDLSLADLAAGTSVDLAIRSNSDLTVNGATDLAMTSTTGDAATSENGDLAGTENGCNTPGGCYVVYAHGDYTLYSVDLLHKTLITVGPFNAPMVSVSGKMEQDVITDLAVSPANVIYVISHTNLYTANPTTGQVTLVAPVANCGSEAVALTFTPDGTLYAGDYKGAFCKVDISQTPPVVTQVGTLGNGLALSGDMVAVADGTIFGTAYKLADATNMGTQINNLLVTIDPTTAAATEVGTLPTGYPKLFGVSYALGQVFAFTHDNTGRVVTIDSSTGVGTLYNTFNDPTTNMPIAFAGAGVNPRVQRY